VTRLTAAVAVAVLLLVTALTGDARAQTNVAVVDLQQCVMKTEDGLSAQATLKRMFDARQNDLNRRQKELLVERDSIERQARILSRKAFQRRMEHWQQRMVEVQTKFVDYNKELQTKQAQMTAPIVQKMLAIIKRIATQRGYDMVIDKQAVPYARGDLDLSDAVVQMYNSGAGGD